MTINYTPYTIHQKLYLHKYGHGISIDHRFVLDVTRSVRISECVHTLTIVADMGGQTADHKGLGVAAQGVLE